MNKEKYIVTDEELALLERYDGILRQKKDPYRFDSFNKDSLTTFLVMSERTSDMFQKRYAAAKDVIDMSQIMSELTRTAADFGFTRPIRTDRLRFSNASRSGSAGAVKRQKLKGGCRSLRKKMLF